MALRRLQHKRQTSYRGDRSDTSEGRGRREPGKQRTSCKSLYWLGHPRLSQDADVGSLDPERHPGPCHSIDQTTYSFAQGFYSSRGRVDAADLGVGLEASAGKKGAEDPRHPLPPSVSRSGNPDGVLQGQPCPSFKDRQFLVPSYHL